MSVLRPHAEVAYADELAALAVADDRPRPPQWRLSPWAVVTYLLGGRLADGTEITPKYIGQRRLIEIAVATLATDRALLLLGVPGTAKTWVSEHLAAAISGDSSLLVQGTAGTTEETLRYGWNYALLLLAGAQRGCARAEPRVPGDACGPARPRRGADPDAIGGPGRPRHDALREGPADPRARHRAGCRRRLQPHRHRQCPRSRRQRDVQCPSSALQHRGPAVAGNADRGDGDRHASGRRARRAPSICRPCPPPPRKSNALSTMFRECAPGAPPMSGRA